jgi:hypothetical protein
MFLPRFNLVGLFRVDDTHDPFNIIFWQERSRDMLYDCSRVSSKDIRTFSFFELCLEYFE